MFLDKIRNIFCVRNKEGKRAQEGKQGNICVGNNRSLFARAFKLPVKAFASTTATQVTTPESKNVIGQMKKK